VYLVQADWVQTVLVGTASARIVLLTGPALLFLECARRLSSRRHSRFATSFRMCNPMPKVFQGKKRLGALAFADQAHLCHIQHDLGRTWPVVVIGAHAHGVGAGRHHRARRYRSQRPCWGTDQGSQDLNSPSWSNIPVRRACRRPPGTGSALRQGLCGNRRNRACRTRARSPPVEPTPRAASRFGTRTWRLVLLITTGLLLPGVRFWRHDECALGAAGLKQYTKQNGGSNRTHARILAREYLARDRWTKANSYGWPN
jgi:hypothetical protein